MFKKHDNLKANFKPALKPKICVFSNLVSCCHLFTDLSKQ